MDNPLFIPNKKYLTVENPFAFYNPKVFKMAHITGLLVADEIDRIVSYVIGNDKRCVVKSQNLGIVRVFGHVVDVEVRIYGCLTQILVEAHVFCIPSITDKSIKPLVNHSST